MYYDIFNGDADGIFSLHQYRLENPLTGSRLLTGVKRDINLLSRVQDVRGCTLTVFDISLDSNRIALLRLLRAQNSIRYFDHHFSGDIPDSPNLQSYIDTSPETCTSLIVHSRLSGQYALWAICGAFGDNLHRPARELAKRQNLSSQEIIELQELGELFNYNGYGSSLDDLHFDPLELYKAIRPFANPFDYIRNSTQLDTLRTGYKEDIDLALQQPEMATPGKNRVYWFPDTPWARRVVGVFSNLRAREQTASAHAVITENRDGSLRVSVRAPLEDQRHANTVCKLFPTGGGRAAAAGINNLPADMFDRFLDTFHSFYP